MLKMWGSWRVVNNKVLCEFLGEKVTEAHFVCRTSWRCIQVTSGVCGAREVLALATIEMRWFQRRASLTCGHRRSNLEERSWRQPLVRSATDNFPILAKLSET